MTLASELGIDVHAILDGEFELYELPLHRHILCLYINGSCVKLAEKFTRMTLGKHWVNTHAKSTSRQSEHQVCGYYRYDRKPAYSYYWQVCRGFPVYDGDIEPVMLPFSCMGFYTDAIKKIKKECVNAQQT